MDWTADLWLDGMNAQNVKYTPPFKLQMKGYVHVHGGPDWYGREPFEAEFLAAAHHHGLERFVVRFGDYSRLLEAKVIRAEVENEYPKGAPVYRFRIGRSIVQQEGQLVDWGFELSKANEGSSPCRSAQDGN
jgi:hypothetical protein